MENNLIRVAATSSPYRVAGAIAQQMRTERQVSVQAIGAGAVNQMIKSLIIARSYLQADQIQPVCVPSFVEVTVDGQLRTAVHLLVLSGIGKINVVYSASSPYNGCIVKNLPDADASSPPSFTALASVVPIMTNDWMMNLVSIFQLHSQIQMVQSTQPRTDKSVPDTFLHSCCPGTERKVTLGLSVSMCDWPCTGFHCIGQTQSRSMVWLLVVE
jgi:stage V sporulation protein S